MIDIFTQIKFSLPGNITIDLSVNNKPFTLTLTVHTALKFPSSDITIISHVPSSTALTSPSSFTVAIEVLELFQVNFIFVVFDGKNSYNKIPPISYTLHFSPHAHYKSIFHYKHSFSSLFVLRIENIVYIWSCII